MEPLAGYVITGIVMLMVGLLLERLSAKVRIVWWSPHHFFYELTELAKDATLMTHSLTIQNIGRKTADFVEVVHRQKPDYFKLDPPLDYTESTTPSDNHAIRVKSLGPKEFFNVQFLSYATMPELLYIRSEVGHAKQIPIMPARQFPPWVYRVMWVLMIVGAGFVVYWALRAIVFILKGMGVIS